MLVCPECGQPQSAGDRCPADGTPLAPVGDDVLIGSTIGAYRVARLLGIGGMGRVYKGVHPTIGSRVAIKVLSRECSDRRDLVERFFSEAKAVNLIRHESIVNVLDLSMLPDGRPYIIMEYLDGAPLSAIIERAIQTRDPLPIGGLARLAVEVLDALGAAHAKGIVHRDLKPDNIFVTPSGRPKVLDFGIAKLNDQSLSSATRTGSLLGTPHYMSPEQAAGRPVDHRADIYAIGVILFECATGRKPFVAESLFDLLRMHVEAQAPSPRQWRHDLSPEVEHVILAALEKSPDRRFASAQAMSMALQSATATLSPEQWTPITGSGTHRAQPSGGWQPTAPASWGGPSRAAPRESVQPPNQMMAMPPQPGQPPTLHPAPLAQSSSKKGLWLGLGAVVLVGGGVAAGIAATSGGDKAPESAAKSTTPGVDQLGDITKLQTEMLGDVMKQLDNLPTVSPEQKKQIEAFRDLQKLPEHERAAKLRELQQQMAKDFGDIGKTLDAIPTAPPAEAPDSIDSGPASPPSNPPRPAAGGIAPGYTPTPPPAKAGPWLVSRDLGFPLDYDPKRIDVAAFVKWAVAEAKRAVPDAELFRIDVDNVRPDGTADLTLPTLASDHGGIDIRFRSPSRMKPDPSIPKGVRQKASCEFRIEAEPDGAELRALDGFPCDRSTPVPAPKCSPAQIWKRALAKRAPADAVANFGYRAVGSVAKWYFDIGEPGEMIFSSVFDDGC